MYRISSFPTVLGILLYCFVAALADNDVDPCSMFNDNNLFADCFVSTHPGIIEDPKLRRKLIFKYHPDKCDTDYCSGITMLINSINNHLKNDYYNIVDYPVEPFFIKTNFEEYFDYTYDESYVVKFGNIKQSDKEILTKLFYRHVCDVNYKNKYDDNFYYWDKLYAKQGYVDDRSNLICNDYVYEDIKMPNSKTNFEKPKSNNNRSKESNTTGIVQNNTTAVFNIINVLIYGVLLISMTIWTKEYNDMIKAIYIISTILAISLDAANIIYPFIMLSANFLVKFLFNVSKKNLIDALVIIPGIYVCVNRNILDQAVYILVIIFVMECIKRNSSLIAFSLFLALDKWVAEYHHLIYITVILYFVMCLKPDKNFQNGLFFMLITLAMVTGYDYNYMLNATPFLPIMFTCLIYCLIYKREIVNICDYMTYKIFLKTYKYVLTPSTIINVRDIITYGAFYINEMCLLNLPLENIQEGFISEIIDDTVCPIMCDPKIGARLYGVSSKYIPNLQLRCAHSELNCARNRCTFSIESKFGKHEPVQDVINDFKTFVMNNVENIFGMNNDVPIMELQDWLDRFKGPKLDVKLAALQHAELFAYADSIKSPKGVFKRKYFMKRELIMKQVLSKFQPRLVTGATSEVNVIWGRYVFTFAKIFAAIFGGAFNDYTLPCNKQSCFVYASGHNREDLGKIYYDYINTHSDILYIESDESRYDSMQVTWVMQLLHDIIRKIIPHDELVNKILLSRAWGMTGYLTKGVFIKRNNGSRGSGDQDTTFGNSLLQMLKCSYVLYKCTGKNPFVDKIDVKGFILGDDNYIMGESSLMMKYYNVAAKINEQLGFHTKTIITDKYTATFCSSLFVANNDVAILSPLPGKVFARTFWNLKGNLKTMKSFAYMKIIIMGLYADLYWCKGVRFLFDQLYDLLDFVDENLYLEKFEKWKHSHKSILLNQKDFSREKGSNFETTDLEYYDIMWFRYGITEDIEQDFIKNYNPVMPFHIIDHEFINRLVLVDGYGVSLDDLDLALEDDCFVNSDAFYGIT
jgi:hypothetical protein